MAAPKSHVPAIVKNVHFTTSELYRRNKS